MVFGCSWLRHVEESVWNHFDRLWNWLAGVWLNEKSFWNIYMYNYVYRYILYIYIYICMYVCICIYIYIYMYIYRQHTKMSIPWNGLENNKSATWCVSTVGPLISMSSAPSWRLSETHNVYNGEDNALRLWSRRASWESNEHLGSDPTALGSTWGFFNIFWVPGPSVRNLWTSWSCWLRDANHMAFPL